MKRSQINKEINHAKQWFDRIGFKLPPFAFWNIDQWRGNRPAAREIIDNCLGWDVTDYGLNDFNRTGLLLFTIRNGNLKADKKYPKTYAEKIMVLKEGQISPMHFHWKKTEDIINRGGGNLVIEVHESTSEEKLSQGGMTVLIDSIEKRVTAGEPVILEPGQSIFLEPYIYHKFYAEKGRGTVVIGEVSQVNDDETDNRFYDPIGRFPEITEDEPPAHLLCTEYEKWINLTA